MEEIKIEIGDTLAYSHYSYSVQGFDHGSESGKRIRVLGIDGPYKFNFDGVHRDIKRGLARLIKNKQNINLDDLKVELSEQSKARCPVNCTKNWTNDDHYSDTCTEYVERWVRSQRQDYIKSVSGKRILKEMLGVSRYYNASTQESSFNVSSRTFDSGAKRSQDTNKPLPSELDPYVRMRVGYLLKQGADKYGKGNWRKLIPEDSAFESLHRHLAEYELDKHNNKESTEDHLASIIFNVMTLMKHEEKSGIPINRYFKKEQ